MSQPLFVFGTIDALFGLHHGHILAGTTCHGLKDTIYDTTRSLGTLGNVLHAGAQAV